MPQVNWDAFGQLPGSAQNNFEMLCRAIIRRHYGMSGQFAARANQPGVEFHLKINTACSLGESGRWFGWQCRWYDLPGGRAIGKTRRKKIAEAITKSERILPGLTDWVLWTRRPLTEGDQKWFGQLKTHMQLHLWTAAEVEEHLSGEAEILRGTYFGELVLIPNTLAALHNASVAPIRLRWLPEVHQIVRAERTLRRMLGETGSWEQLLKVSERLANATSSITKNLKSVASPLAETTATFISTTQILANASKDLCTLLNRGDLDLVRQQLTTLPSVVDQNLSALPRKLRATRQSIALIATNALADIRLANTLFQKVDQYLGTRLVGVLAGAGGGKTQLAAQLTSPASNRPAGILLHGRDLGSHQGLNELAGGVTIEGVPVASMEALIAAVDAAGQRAHCRLPIIIDGLNEAEDPRTWKGPLASLDETLRRYPHVLVVCTVRHAILRRSGEFRSEFQAESQEPTFADEALPDGIERLYIPDFGPDTVEAIRRYFAYYQINATDAELPFELLGHPLTLRLFCDVTNPTREHEVGIEAMPGSLTALFERYLDQAAARIAELASLTKRYCQQDVRAALDKIGWAIWEEKTRSLDLKALQKRLGEEGCLWNDSLIRALEQDGILLRNPGEPPDGSRVAGVYDMLSGHLVAKAILSRTGRDGLQPWLKSPGTQAAMSNSYADRHPFAAEIFSGLVGLIPRRLNGNQLWTLLDEPLRGAALHAAANLEGAYLDQETVNQIGILAGQVPNGSRDIFDRLWTTRGASAHPLNAEYLDGILRAMSMKERDLRWTEWIRHNSKDVVSDLQSLERRWCNSPNRISSDTLRARWSMWTLTSTVRLLRDQATRALHWFGRGDPATLFEMTLNALSINDPYVPERMLAAAYGTAMALRSQTTVVGFRDSILPDFAMKLYESMFAESAPFSTTHALMRDYARHTIQLAMIDKPKTFTTAHRQRVKSPFGDGGIREWGRHDGFGDELKFGFSGPMQMDFANYTLGRLVPDRRNYDYDNDQYKEVVANMYWRLVQLRYSPVDFDKIDKAISSDHWGGRSEGNEGRVDRYGKKYSWIAFYELYGFRFDQGLLKSEYCDEGERPSDIDIDPSFPGEPRDIKILSTDWLGDRKRSLKTWIERGGQPDISSQLSIDNIDGAPGPWILLDGYVAQLDEEHKRAMFAFPRGLLVSRKYSSELQGLLSKQKLGVLRLPDVPQDHYTFAGEIPWCETFPKNGRADIELHAGYRVKRVPHDDLRFYHQRKLLNEMEVRTLIAKIPDTLERDARVKALEDILKEEQVTIRGMKSWKTERETISKIIPVLVPVRQSNWEGYHSGVNPSQHVSIPTREIAQKFGLSMRPPGWDMFDKQGQLAATSIKWGNLWTNGQSFCYLRQDLLNRFLAQSQLEFFWILWGAREARLDRDDLPKERLDFKHTRKEFQRIYRYNKGLVVAGKAAEYYR